MEDLAAKAQPAVDKLMQFDEAKLYAELGKRLKAIQREPSASADFDLEIMATNVEALGPWQDLNDFGKRFFDRFNRQAYELVCGADSENTKERQSLLQAFGFGADAVAATLAALLVAHLAIAPAIAAVCATLAIKLFFKPGHAAMCDVWKEKLPKT